MSFSYEPCSVKIIFGINIKEALKLEIEKEGSKNFIIFSSKRYASLVDDLKEIEGLNLSLFFDEEIQHVPLELVEKAKRKIKNIPANVLLAIGGGSTIGLAKAIAYENHLPVWTVPTTYSGSEMTNIYGISKNGEKIVKKSPWVLPKKAFYDPELTSTLPFGLAASSGFNALAHALEALYSPSSNPLTYQAAKLAIFYLMKGIDRLSIDQKLNHESNQNIQLGGCISGKVLCEVSMALHHKSAHVLGGSFKLEHSKVHTVLLAYVLEYQWDYLDEKIKEEFQQLFSHHYPPQRIKTTIEDMGLESNLRQIGFKREDIENAAALISKINFENPAPVKSELIVQLLKKAYEGQLQDK